jgi:molybdopterin-containing oxidoreductase family iron-sulfur binding subunit
MTVTGANADERISVRSGEEIWVALALAHEILVSRKLSKFAADPQVIQALQPFSGSRVAAATGISDLTKRVSEMADRLWKSRGESLVVAGGISTKSEYSKGLQVVCALLNSALENEGKTVDGTARALTRVVSPLARLVKLVEELRSGQVDALIVVGANPVYHVPATMGFAAAMEKAKLVVSIADRMDETAVLSDVVLPESHFLEAWGDAELVKGVVSLQQPTLAPIHNSRSYGEIFLSWSKALPKTSTKFQEVGTYYEVLRAQWKSKVHPETKSGISFEAFWEKSLRDGLALMPSARSARATVRTFQTSALSVLPRAITERKGDFSLTIYPKVGLYDGRQANNPWLQEFPDPISTATWDNYVNVGPEDAKRLNLAADDVVEVQNEKGAKLELPVLIQPGLRFGTISIAMGYGRTAAGRIGTGVGADVGPMVEFGAQGLIWAGIPVKLRKTGRRYQVAITQWHHVSENRPIVNDITLGDYLTDPAMANHTDPHLRLDPVPTMWPKFEYKNYKWSMAIDLNSCTGCGACVVGCQAENNIPVVGRDNVRVSREMHWIRIDRYYSGDENQPNVVFSPMLCQHCDNAPCETVCPVVATVHNNEGLNEQVYNRCVGTRYCQNNCPYKVRRFNFFDHWKSYEGSMNLSWNPDITVRSRGIMEKCTFCVHKIMDAKSKAKDEGRRVKDGDFQTACQQACPTEAIVFGDINDSESRVNRLAKDPRAYRVLEVLNTKPAISYLTKVRNQEGTTLHHPKGGHHGESEKGHG